jgi:hypothetical protein
MRSGWGQVLLSQVEGTEVQIRMDDCTKETSAYGRRTQKVNHSELAGAKKDDVAWASRYVGVALENRKQQK